jgi:hypothetical protein
MRRAWIVGLILLLGLVTVAVYFYFGRTGTVSKGALAGIPNDAVLIWRADDLSASADRLAHNSILWEELSSLSVISETNRMIAGWDSLLSSYPDGSDFLLNSTFISWHSIGKKRIGWLSVTEITEGTDLEDLQALLHSSGSTSQERKVNDQSVYACVLSGIRYHYALEGDLLLLSSYGSLVERGLEQLNSDFSLSTDLEFMRIYETAGTPEHGVVLYKTDQIHHLLTPLLLKEIDQFTQSALAQTGSWAALDLSLKSDAIMLSGFTTYQDSAGFALEAFESQKPEDHDMVEVLPENTAAFIHYGFSNANGWFQKKREGLAVQNQLFAYDKSIADIENEYGFRYDKNLLSWIEHEVACGFLEGRSKDIKERLFCVTKAANIELAKKNLTELENRTALLSKITPDIPDSTIGYIGVSNLFGPIFGAPFNQLKHAYFTMIDKYVIWANNPQVLQEIRNRNLKDKTLGEADGYRQLAEHISEESNIFVYADIARSSTYLDQFLNPEFAPKTEEDIAFLRQFQAITYQYSYERPGLFYTHAYFVHNPIYKEVSYSLWELALEAPARMKPTIVKNHYTGAKEIFIQDRENHIYLVSNSGKILWKRALSEPILSEVTQVDVYGNNKLQLLFNTKSKLFLIDRNGHDVPGYSVELEEKATAGLTCLDYSGNHKYRILVPAENGILYDFDNDGKQVNGWKHKSEDQNIAHPIKYFSIKNKDYLVARLADGTVKAYDRRGRVRIDPLQEKISAKPATSVLTTGNDLTTTYLTVTDSSGTVNTLYFNGTLEKKDFGSYSPKHLFLYTDLNQDGVQDYLFADKGKVTGFDNSGERLLEYEVPTGDIVALNTYVFESGVSIGITTDEGEIFLIDKTETLFPFFPMKGLGEFTITDLNNDGAFNLLVSDNSGLLYCYRLER